MTDWCTRFMDLAHHVARWSKDNSTKVGAVIVDNDKRIVSLGFNGPPRFVSDEHGDRMTKLLRTLHAEENAILFARGNVEGYTMYVTHHPCAHCAAVIAQVGLARVLIPPVEPAFEARWAEHIIEARKTFAAADIELYTITPKSEIL